jgi:hypothetical protein
MRSRDDYLGNDPVSWNDRDNNKMIIIDNDENPVNDAMILLQQTEENKYSFDAIYCQEDKNNPSVESQ